MCLVAGEINESERLLQEAEEQAKKLDIKEVEVETALVRIPFLTVTGQLAEAAKLSQRILITIDELNLFQLKPIVTMCLGEIEALNGNVKKAIAYFDDARAQSAKMKRLVPLAASTLGLIELKSNGFNQKVPAKVFDPIEKQIRVSSSRRMRAKFLLLKGLADNPKFLHQAIDVADHAGLLVLLHAMLDVCIFFCRKRGLTLDLKAFEEKKKELKKKPFDFNLIRPLTAPQIEMMPVSMMI
jgi:hypothetical protein